MSDTIAIERIIVNKVIDSAIGSGYAVRLHDGGAWATPVTNSAKDIMDNIMNTDEETLVIYRDLEGIHRAGFVLFVYGNDGWDVIADNTDNVEINDILSEVFAWIDDNEY